MTISSYYYQLSPILRNNNFNIIIINRIDNKSKDCMLVHTVQDLKNIEAFYQIVLRPFEIESHPKMY